MNFGLCQLSQEILAYAFLPWTSSSPPWHGKCYACQGPECVRGCGSKGGRTWGNKQLRHHHTTQRGRGDCMYKRERKRWQTVIQKISKELYFSYKMGCLIFSLEMDYFSSIPDAEVELGQGSSPNYRSRYSSYISPCKHQKCHFDPASNKIQSKAVPVWGVYKLVCLRGFSMTVK